MLSSRLHSPPPPPAPHAAAYIYVDSRPSRVFPRRGLIAAKVRGDKGTSHSIAPPQSRRLGSKDLRRGEKAEDPRRTGAITVPRIDLIDPRDGTRPPVSLSSGGRSGAPPPPPPFPPSSSPASPRRPSLYTRSLVRKATANFDAAAADAKLSNLPRHLLRSRDTRTRRVRLSPPTTPPTRGTIAIDISVFYILPFFLSFCSF